MKLTRHGHRHIYSKQLILSSGDMDWGASLPSTTTTSATAESTAAAAGATLGSLVNADGAAVEPARD